MVGRNELDLSLQNKLWWWYMEKNKCLDCCWNDNCQFQTVGVADWIDCSEYRNNLMKTVIVKRVGGNKDEYRN